LNTLPLFTVAAFYGDLPRFYWALVYLAGDLELVCLTFFCAELLAACLVGEVLFPGLGPGFKPVLVVPFGVVVLGTDFDCFRFWGDSLI
jgi:hypothetical protein